MPRDCRVFLAINPAGQWGWQESFLNKAANLLDVIVWQNSNAGLKKSKQSKKPEPFIPDFLRKKIEGNKELEAHTTDEIDRILASVRS